MTPLILASASPRRRELLATLDLSLEVEAPDISETLEGDALTPQALVQELALRKCQAVADRRRHGLVLGADTVVVLEGRVLGKPESLTEARQMLKRLRGRTHQVFTGVALVDVASGITQTAHRESQVTMRPYADDEVEAFLASGEAMDKAGAYSVQDVAFRPAARISGCYVNVIGLPLCTVAQLLEELGVTMQRGTSRPPSHPPELGPQTETCWLCIDGAAGRSSAP